MNQSQIGDPAHDAPSPDMRIGDIAAFVATHWRRQPCVLSTGHDFRDLISEDEIWSDLEHGLLTPPYFSVVVDGVARDPSTLVRSRSVAGRTAHGYAEPGLVRAAIEAGATYILNHLEHWKPSVAALASDVARAVDCRTEAFAFYSPPGQRGLRAHTDGSHVLVVQVSGTKDWLVGYIDDESVATGGTHGSGNLNPADCLVATLKPGDVMYIPHGAPHQAVARRSPSLHIAITLEEPTPLDFVRDIVDAFVAGPAGAEIEATWLARSEHDRLDLLRQAFAHYVREL